MKISSISAVWTKACASSPRACLITTLHRGNGIMSKSNSATAWTRCSFLMSRYLVSIMIYWNRGDNFRGRRIPRMFIKKRIGRWALVWILGITRIRLIRAYKVRMHLESSIFHLPWMFLIMLMKIKMILRRIRCVFRLNARYRASMKKSSMIY